MCIKGHTISYFLEVIKKVAGPIGRTPTLKILYNHKHARLLQNFLRTLFICVCVFYRNT